MKAILEVLPFERGFVFLLIISILLNLLLGTMKYITKETTIGSSFFNTSPSQNLVIVRPGSATLELEHMAVPPKRPFGYEESAKRTRLTHLVMPFHHRQEEQAIRNLEMWRLFPPCPGPEFDESPDSHYFRRSHGSVPLGRNITLVFFLNCDRDPGLEDRLLSTFAVLPADVRACFTANPIVRFGKLTEEQDTYLSGSRNMFEKMLNGHIGLVEPSYVLYMEPDCLPIRKHWLMLLDGQTRFPTAPFWMKGSAFRGNHTAFKSPNLMKWIHLNGNAIYNMGDPAFRHFYFDHVRPFIFNAQIQGAYDTDIFMYLMEPKYFSIARSVIHMFQHTDSIQNYWHSNYTVSKLTEFSPTVVLVHGGRQIRS